jgi:1-acyl-sn-glycerol-3-phosphate acyltransferase
MIRFLRAAIRFPMIMAWVFLMWGMRLTLMPLLQRDEALDRRWKKWWYQRWAKGVCRIMGLRVEVRGALPAEPGYIVCNHLGYTDVFALSAAFGCVFVAMEDISRWPLLGPIAKTLYTVFVDRTDKTRAAEVLPLMRRAIEMGDWVLIFPEGGVSRSIAVDPFKSPLIEPAVQLGRPVAHAALHYETAPGSPPASTIVGWWRPEPVLHHFLRLLSYPGVTCTITVGVIDPAGMDRKQLAKALHEAVSSNFIPHP